MTAHNILGALAILCFGAATVRLPADRQTDLIALGLALLTLVLVFVP